MPIDKPEKGYRKTRFGDYVQAPRTPKDSAGHRGLALSIIDRARRDFLFSKSRSIAVGAAKYFTHPDYRHLLGLLGIEESYLPDGITSLRLKFYIEKYTPRRLYT